MKKKLKEKKFTKFKEIKKTTNKKKLKRKSK
jgi:hypothetical protein